MGNQSKEDHLRLKMFEEAGMAPVVIKFSIHISQSTKVISTKLIQNIYLYYIIMYVKWANNQTHASCKGIPNKRTSEPTSSFMPKVWIIF